MTIEEISEEISTENHDQGATNAMLEKIATVYGTNVIDHWERLYEKKANAAVAFMQRFFPETRDSVALELGCADGTMSSKLMKHFGHLHVLDGSLTFLGQTKRRFPLSELEKVSFHHGLFENFSSEVRYDAIFMAHVLEHLDDPVGVLKKYRTLLKPQGRLFALVPNANSLHRYAGVQLGLLSRRTDLNSQDQLVGHQRIYTPELLSDHIREAGYKILHFGGIMVKPLSNRQLEEQWSDELMDAYIRMGQDLPELSSEIFYVCESA